MFLTYLALFGVTHLIHNKGVRDDLILAELGIAAVAGVLWMWRRARPPVTLVLADARSSPSFWKRKRDDIWVNAVFTLVGAVIGFGLGRI